MEVFATKDFVKLMRDRLPPEVIDRGDVLIVHLDQTDRKVILPTVRDSAEKGARVILVGLAPVGDYRVDPAVRELLDRFKATFVSRDPVTEITKTLS